MMTMWQLVFTLGVMFALGMCAGVGVLIAVQETQSHTKRDRRERERKACEAVQAQLRG